MDKLNLLNKYKVLILAAGVGKRLKEKGKNSPKSLLKIDKKTIIENLLDILKKRRFSDITIAVGYKKKKFQKFIESKNYKIKFLEIKDFAINGSSFSWYSFRKKWERDPKPLIILHADIFFDENLFENIIKSKHKNIIGSVCSKNKILKKKWVVYTNSKEKITEIKLKKVPKNTLSNEISCINKFSTNVSGKIFMYMRDYFIRYNSHLTWEIVLNHFINQKKAKIYSLKNQKFFWFNINKISDLKEANSFYKKFLY